MDWTGTYISYLKVLDNSCINRYNDNQNGELYMENNLELETIIAPNLLEDFVMGPLYTIYLKIKRL